MFFKNYKLFVYMIFRYTVYTKNYKQLQKHTIKLN